METTEKINPDLNAFYACADANNKEAYEILYNAGYYNSPHDVSRFTKNLPFVVYCLVHKSKVGFYNNSEESFFEKNFVKNFDWSYNSFEYIKVGLKNILKGDINTNLIVKCLDLVSNEDFFKVNIDGYDLLSYLSLKCKENGLETIFEHLSKRGIDFTETTHNLFACFLNGLPEGNGLNIYQWLLNKNEVDSNSNLLNYTKQDFYTQLQNAFPNVKLKINDPIQENVKLVEDKALINRMDKAKSGDFKGLFNRVYGGSGRVEDENKRDVLFNLILNSNWLALSKIVEYRDKLEWHKPDIFGLTSALLYPNIVKGRDTRPQATSWYVTFKQCWDRQNREGEYDKQFIKDLENYKNTLKEFDWKNGAAKKLEHLIRPTLSIKTYFELTDNGSSYFKENATRIKEDIEKQMTECIYEIGINLFCHHMKSLTGQLVNAPGDKVNLSKINQGLRDVEKCIIVCDPDKATNPIFNLISNIISKEENKKHSYSRHMGIDTRINHPTLETHFMQKFMNDKRFSEIDWDSIYRYVSKIEPKSNLLPFFEKVMYSATNVSINKSAKVKLL